MGPERAAIVRSRGVAAKQGFIMCYTKGVAIGSEVTVRYRESGRLSGVVVKRGSTVFLLCMPILFVHARKQPATPIETVQSVSRV